MLPGAGGGGEIRPGKRAWERPKEEREGRKSNLADTNRKAEEGEGRRRATNGRAKLFYSFQWEEESSICPQRLSHLARFKGPILAAAAVGSPLVAVALPPKQLLGENAEKEEKFRGKLNNSLRDLRNLFGSSLIHLATLVDHSVRQRAPLSFGQTEEAAAASSELEKKAARP